MDFTTIIPERFRVAYDQNSGVWRILDTWHPQIANIADFAEEIPDNSPAIKIISDLEMNAILAKIDEMGWLEKIIRKKVLDIKDASIVLKTMAFPPSAEEIKPIKRTVRKKRDRIIKEPSVSV